MVDTRRLPIPVWQLLRVDARLGRRQQDTEFDATERQLSAQDREIGEPHREFPSPDWITPIRSRHVALGEQPVVRPANHRALGHTERREPQLIVSPHEPVAKTHRPGEPPVDLLLVLGGHPPLRRGRRGILDNGLHTTQCGSLGEQPMILE